jgi:hypothetical protein
MTSTTLLKTGETVLVSSMKPFFLLSLVALGTVLATCVGGCGEPNQAQTSSAYQKLPPGEGERRLKETLAKRSGAKPDATPPAGVAPATTP